MLPGSLSALSSAAKISANYPTWEGSHLCAFIIDRAECTRPVRSVGGHLVIFVGMIRIYIFSRAGSVTVIEVGYGFRLFFRFL